VLESNNESGYKVEVVGGVVVRTPLEVSNNIFMSLLHWAGHAHGSAVPRTKRSDRFSVANEHLMPSATACGQNCFCVPGEVSL